MHRSRHSGHTSLQEELKLFEEELRAQRKEEAMEEAFYAEHPIKNYWDDYEIDLEEPLHLSPTEITQPEDPIDWGMFGPDPESLEMLIAECEDEDHEWGDLVAQKARARPY